MDLYLHSGGRVKGEYFPDSISGLSRCSRTEIHDDIEFIQANLPFNANILQQGQGQGQTGQLQQQSGQDEQQEQLDDLDDPDGVVTGSSTVPYGTGTGGGTVLVRGIRKEKRKLTRAERIEVDLERDAAASKRARLLHKISQERHRLDSTKETGYHLRQTLDSLRTETQQYEDAIAQTKREMEMISRETQILEERLQQSRSEYHWGLDQAERIRIEEEKIETILREKLSQVNGQVNDVSDRVHQLRQLEEEFKLKDVRIQQLETECSKYETQIQLLDQLITKQISPTGASSQPPSASGVTLPQVLAAHAPPLPAPSPTPQTATSAVVDPNIVTVEPVGNSASEVIVKDEDTNMKDVEQSNDTKMEPTTNITNTDLPTSETSVVPPSAPIASGTIEDAIMSPATANPSLPAPIASVPTVTTSVGPTSGPSPSTLSGITPLLPIPTGPNPSLTELLASIHSSTTTIAHLTMTLKLHEEQLESSNRQLIDRDRAMKYMQEQIERFSNLNHELNYKLKQSENLTLEERAKLEQSYKQILFAQKQKDEQSCIISGYEEKLKVFEQLLNVADVRATGAEENVAEMLAELKSTRMSNQILQTGYNKLLKEYERSVREKYASMEEAHKIAETLQASGMIPGAGRAHVRFDSAGGESTVETPTATSGVHSTGSPRQLNFGVKEEVGGASSSVVPKTPPKIQDDPSYGFGGINGLASPMDHSMDHGHTSSHAAYGAHKFEFNATTFLNSAAMASPSSASLASPAGSQGYGQGLAAFVPDLPDSANTPALAAHYQKFNLLLTAQNRELSLKLNQMTHHNTQLQMALVKLAHRPAKGSSYIMNATATPTGPHVPILKSESSLSGHPSVSMDIDTPMLPATNSSRLTKTSSSSSSPLATPKSPLPPLHPKKPIIQEELAEL